MSTGGDPTFWQWGTLVGGAVAALLAGIFGINMSKKQRESDDGGDKREDVIRELGAQLSSVTAQLSAVNLQREFETDIRRMRDDLSDVISSLQISINGQLSDIDERLRKIEMKNQ